MTSVEVEAAPNSDHIPVVTVETAAAATVTVTASSGDHQVAAPTSEAGTTHEIAVLGLRTGLDYELSVEATSADGTGQATAEYTTPPLPDHFPTLEVTSQPDQVSPGVVLVPLIRPPNDLAGDTGDSKTGRLVGLDEEGEVVWYYETELQVISVEPTPRGTLLLGIDDSRILNMDGVAREIDMLGNTVAEWHSRLARRSGKAIETGPDGVEVGIAVDTDSFHHDAHELPNGNIIALSTELIEVDEELGRELCPSNPAVHLLADVVVEFDREGEIVGEWPVAPVFDPVARPGVEMCLPVDQRPAEDWLDPRVADERDWTHANAVTLDEASNTLIVSLRSLDAVIGLRYQDDEAGTAGELLWELGPDGDLEMEGDGLFPRHQHAPKLRDDGTILLYDNGNLRPGNLDAGGTNPPFSRAVIYDIDVEARTVTQVWEHRDESPWGGPTYVPFLGDTDSLENGNVLVTHGVVGDGDRRPHPRILEVVPDIEGGGASNEVVWDLLVGEESGSGWVAYHAAKVASLHPRG